MSTTGLEGVIVADTQLSGVDGEQGALVLRGTDVQSLAAGGRIERAVGLLWDGSIDPSSGWVVRLGEGRLRAWQHLDRARPALMAPVGMDALRGAVAVLSDVTHADLVGAMAVFTGAWWRLSRGLQPVPPDPHLHHAADLLSMIEGGAPDAMRGDALGTYGCTVVDHGMNASTFAARVVASTGSDSTSAVVAALGALKGPLHGGAPGPVLDMLDAIGAPSAAEPWLRGELAAGRRIMGMGHRVYRVRDPRAAVLQDAAVALASAGHGVARAELALAVERAATRLLAEHRPGRRIAANVEFWTAVLLDTIGLDRALFSPLFACARVVGWLAHVDEQRATGRLIRPRARYVGPAAGLTMRQ